MSTNLRCVVIGIGAHVFHKHRTALATAGLELAGACDVDGERGARLAEELGCPFYSDYRTMLQQARADVAVLLIPHPLHAPVAIDCLEAGCHVLVEKPAAISVGELDRMIEAAEVNDRLLATCLQHRTRPEVVRARDMILSGALGVMQRVSVTGIWPRFSRYYEASQWRGTWIGEGGGATINQGIHQLDVLCFLLGAPLRVTAWARRQVHSIETEDTVIGLLEWQSGCLGTVEISTARAEDELSFELIGTRGRLRITNNALTHHEYALDTRDYLRFGHGTEWPRSSASEVALPPKVNGHAALYENLRAAILHGTPLLADGSIARPSLEIANALILSSVQNRTVDLPIDAAAYHALLVEHGAAVAADLQPYENPTWNGVGAEYAGK